MADLPVDSTELEDNANHNDYHSTQSGNIRPEKSVVITPSYILKTTT